MTRKERERIARLHPGWPLPPSLAWIKKPLEIGKKYVVQNPGSKVVHTRIFTGKNDCYYFFTNENSKGRYSVGVHSVHRILAPAEQASA